MRIRLNMLKEQTAYTLTPNTCAPHMLLCGDVVVHYNIKRIKEKKKREIQEKYILYGIQNTYYFYRKLKKKKFLKKLKKKIKNKNEKKTCNIIMAQIICALKNTTTTTTTINEKGLYSDYTLQKKGNE